MFRTTVPAALAAAFLFTFAPSLAAQGHHHSDADKIKDASRAGPAELVADATILDWPEKEGGEFRVLRKGTNGWTCLPDNPGLPNDEPMCLDGEWMGWLKAFAAGDKPKTKKVGLAYMLNSKWAVSNVDPTATDPTDDNQWVEGGSHLMLIAPDLELLAAFPTEPHDGMPYVMWKDTPYAHVMIPVPEAHAGTTAAANR